MELSKHEAVTAFMQGKKVQHAAGIKWINVTCFYQFDHYHTFRIKPEHEELVRQMRVDWEEGSKLTPNLRLEWDPETYELIKAEIIK
jgi:hypothetical protein